jgi:hypothetical protein
MSQKYTVFKKETNAEYFRRARAIMPQQLEETREALRKMPSCTEIITTTEEGGKKTTYNFNGALTKNTVSLQGNAYMEGKVEILAEINADGKLPRVLREVRNRLEDLGFRETQRRSN